MNALCGHDIDRAEAENRLSPVNSLETKLTNNIVLIGSPTSEGLSRLIFGYQGPNSDTLNLISPPVDLPYTFELNADKVEGSAARHIELVKASPLSDKSSLWEDAYNNIKTNLTDWLEP